MKNSIRELRMSMEWTQDELAEKLDVSRQTVISLEKGRYNPSLALAFKLGRLFRCRIEDMFTEE